MDKNPPKLTVVPNLTRAEALEVERQAELKAIAELKAVRAAKKRAANRAKYPGRKKNEPWSPTMRERHQIKICLAAGMTNEAIAAILGICPKTFALRCAREIETGANEVNGKVASKLFQQVMRGNAIAAIYWTKARLGWRETQRTEHTGANGGPIKHESIEAEANAFTEKVEAMARKLALPGLAANDKATAPAEPVEDGKQATP